jgi:hypothetical protein
MPTNSRSLKADAEKFQDLFEQIHGPDLTPGQKCYEKGENMSQTHVSSNDSYYKHRRTGN